MRTGCLCESKLNYNSYGFLGSTLHVKPIHKQCLLQWIVTAALVCTKGFGFQQSGLHILVLNVSILSSSPCVNLASCLNFARFYKPNICVL